MTTGELIQSRRKEAGITQAELGEKMGISGAAVKTRFCPHCGARMENFVAERMGAAK